MHIHWDNIYTKIASVLTAEGRTNTRGLHNDTALISPEKVASVYDQETQDERLPAWQVRLEAVPATMSVELCLEIRHDIILGSEDTEDNVINLLKNNDKILGVSRRHLRLSPTETSLLIVDLESTNGTRKNGRSMQPNVAYHLNHGDILELGDLTLAVKIEKSPRERDMYADDRSDIADVLAHISATLSSNLNITDALDRILEVSMNLCHADEIALLLRDESAERLYLKAEHGIGNEKERLTKIALGKGLPIDGVLQTGESFRAVETDGHQHEVAYGYLVDAALYEPITIGEASMGVLIAMQRGKEKSFTCEDERVLSTLGRFAALAIQNSQRYEVTNARLQNKVDELSLYSTLSKALSKANNLTSIYNTLREQIRARWNIENMGLWLLEEASNNLVPFPKPSFHKTYSLGQDMIGDVASRLEPILATDMKLFSQPTTGHEPTLQLLARSAACVPIVENEKALGVLAVFSTRENEFDAEDIRVLQTFSQAAAAAIRNAWLFEQIDKQRATILAAVNMLPQPMMIVDRDGKIIVSNRAADTMLSDVHSPTNGEPNQWSLISLIHGLSESRWCTKEIIVGEKVYVATLEYASMVGTVILLQDVTDPVTGTSNHRHFHDLAENVFQQAKRYAKPLSALVIGLNDFQRVINEQGHEVSNQVLKRLATELRSFLRTPDILGRCHENEFLVFLPETNLENAKVVAERIKQSMSGKVIETKSCRLTPKLTIGAAMLDTNIHDSVDVFMESVYGEFMLVNNNHKSPKKNFPAY